MHELPFIRLNVPGRDCMNRDVIIIGGGHNGLVNAACPARGAKVLVLERVIVLGRGGHGRDLPGFQVFGLLFVVSLLGPRSSRADLARHQPRDPPLDGTFTPMPDGNHLWRVNDHGRGARDAQTETPTPKRKSKRRP
jgi:phytoene dehydrogenase-like protein